MRHSAARPAWLLAAALLAAPQLPAAGRAQPAASQAAPATQAPANATDDTGRQAPESPVDSNDTAAPVDPGPAPAPPEPPPTAPRAPARRHADATAPIGHFRVYEHPPCGADPCQATISDLESRRTLEATVSLAPMHLAPQLQESARSGQIDLLLSGELRRGPSGPALRALHLEGVTPHTPAAPATPRAGHPRPAPGAATRSRLPAAPPPGLLRA